MVAQNEKVLIVPKFPGSAGGRQVLVKWTSTVKWADHDARGAVSLKRFLYILQSRDDSVEQQTPLIIHLEGWT